MLYNIYCFSETVPEAPQDIMYMPNISDCLFNFTLQGDDLESRLGSMGVLVVARNKNVSCPVRSFTLCTSYLSLELNVTIPRLCTPAGQDIRTNVIADFGEINELIVMETLDNSQTCENGKPANVKYFGRSARLIFNSSATSECVL